MDEIDGSDILGNPEAAHPRARELMTEDFFWDCMDEDAPFGSDEGYEALHEFRDWRASHTSASLVDCLSWIMSGRLAEYNQELLDESRVAQDLGNPDGAFLADHYDMFTLDTTVMATGLAQLIFDGRIDSDAKPYLRVAAKRQLHPEVVSDEHRAVILRAVLRVIEAA
ncbi:MAG: molybdate metabolism regulator [Planctomycetota bacterium]